MAISRPRKFKLHFNRVNMQRGLSTVWTIHLSDRCIAAEEVEVNVPLMAVFRPESRQPRAWLEGRGYIYNVGPNRWVINDGSL
jgi:hypothetical protein